MIFLAYNVESEKWDVTNLFHFWSIFDVIQFELQMTISYHKYLRMPPEFRRGTSAVFGASPSSEIWAEAFASPFPEFLHSSCKYFYNILFSLLTRKSTTIL
jgi:hypothetical protein